jgi:transaldolase
MKDNPLKEVAALGQSIWLDYIRRDLIASGELRRMIEEDGLRGMTSNPAIFEKAIAESHDYDEDIRTMALGGKGAEATLDAYRDHGDPKARLEQDVERARWVLERLSELGISIDKVTQQLEDQGVEKFNKPFDKLMETLAKR